MYCPWGTVIERTCRQSEAMSMQEVKTLNRDPKQNAGISFLKFEEPKLSCELNGIASQLWGSCSELQTRASDCRKKQKPNRGGPELGQF